ncbi:MAG TPA: LysR family transcriptional regulator ArgP [Microlunatus sp.]|jgi:LysR family transcriptional regulator (chromosome initiation inhibitor)|nr:LysR family transcriptional regulator ArgP [Microlunatus sp.]
MDWDLAQLRAFAAIVDHGSLEAAAQTLHLTPSAVSQRLKALERAVGAVLLQRSRPVRATEPGESVLRFARQLDALSRDTAAELGAGAWPAVRVAVNADSLATWVLPALAPLAGELRLELLREGEEHTVDLLRDGSAMAAITTEQIPVQGCTVEHLGAMRYQPMAAPAFAARWFRDGLSTAALAEAPVVVFDAKDRIQHRLLRRHGVSEDPPIHLVPAATQYVEAVRLGIGWGMVPDQQRTGWTAEDAVVLSTEDDEDVALFWQQWALRTPSLERVADAVRAASAEILRRIG